MEINWPVAAISFVVAWILIQVIFQSSHISRWHQRKLKKILGIKSPSEGWLRGNSTVTIAPNAVRQIIGLPEPEETEEKKLERFIQQEVERQKEIDDLISMGGEMDEITAKAVADYVDPFIQALQYYAKEHRSENPTVDDLIKDDKSD